MLNVVANVTAEVAVVTESLATFLNLAVTNLFDDAFDAFDGVELELAVNDLLILGVTDNALGDAFSDGDGTLELVLILGGAGRVTDVVTDGIHVLWSSDVVLGIFAVQEGALGLTNRRDAVISREDVDLGDLTLAGSRAFIHDLVDSVGNLDAVILQVDGLTGSTLSGDASTARNRDGSLTVVLALAVSALLDVQGLETVLVDAVNLLHLAVVGALTADEGLRVHGDGAEGVGVDEDFADCLDVGVAQEDLGGDLAVGRGVQALTSADWLPRTRFGATEEGIIAFTNVEDILSVDNSDKKSDDANKERQNSRHYER